MSKVGNQTNSNDPLAVNSRVFVGNLNTYQVSKEDVERIFKRYGRIGGISMHKGYAFIQYSNPYEARNATSSEDGNVVCGQMLDVNMVAEPKLHQTGRKRQNLTNTGNDWDYYYDSYSNQSGQQQQLQQQQQQQQRLTPPNKRARMGNVNNNGGGGGAKSAQQQRLKSGKTTKANGSSGVLLPANSNKQSAAAHHNTSATQRGAGGDILICGNCKEVFGGVQKMVEHKKSRCRLRFTCRCQGAGAPGGGGASSEGERKGSDDGNEPSSYTCATCKEKHASAWELVQHVQSSHQMAIYDDSAAEQSDGGAQGDGAKEGGAKKEGGGEEDEAMLSPKDEGEEEEEELLGEEEEAGDELAIDGSSCGTNEEAEWNQIKSKGGAGAEQL